MKLYRTRTQVEYDWLMQKLEEEGCVWASGRKPTELDYSKQHDVVSVGRFMAKEIWREEFKKGATDQPIIEVFDLMNTKFKVGDEVRVIEETPGILFGNTVGNVCKIKKVNNEDELAYELD